MSIVFTDKLDFTIDLNGLAPGRIVSTSIGDSVYLLISPDLAYGNNTGLLVAELGNNGALSVVDFVGEPGDPVDGYIFRDQGLVAHEMGDVTRFYTQGTSNPDPFTFGRGISVLEMDSDGDISVLQFIPKADAISGLVSQNGVDPVIAQTNGRDFLVQASGYGTDLSVYRIKSDGTLAFKSELTGLDDASGGLDTITIDDRGFVVTTGPYLTGPIQVHRVSQKGAIKTVFELDPNEPLTFNRILNDVKIETVGTRTFVFVSENTRGSISVFEMSASGELEIVGYEAGGIGDRWTYPYSLDTFKVDGITYLAAAGVGSGIGVFAVSENGALTEVDEWQFEASALRNVNELTVAELDGQDFVLVTSPLDNSVRSFRVDEFDPVLNGSGGRNTIEGTEDDDRIFGFGGSDTLRGGDGDDLIEGGNRGDLIEGGRGLDDIYGQSGNDTILGEDGDDWLFGQDGRDSIDAGPGNDFVRGGNDKDTIDGGLGNDRIFGDNGNDKLRGDAGNDTIEDGRGKDTLEGGSGADEFILVAGDGKQEKILDFDDGFDKINLTSEGSDLSFPDLTITQKTNGVLVTYDGGSIRILPDEGTLTVSDIGLDDFIFLT